MKSEVFVILLNYKGYDDTAECIKSLRGIAYPDFHIVVVDNCSGDGSYEALTQNFPDCTVLQSGENNGFSAGNNIGIRYALDHGADFVMLLNNDTVASPDFLDKMMAEANQSTVVTPRIYYYDDKSEIYYAAGKINRFKCTAENGDPEKSGYVDYASGCCMLIPRTVIETIGLWSEEFFLYYEDMDYSLRILGGGFRIYYCGDAVVYHKEGRSTGKKSKTSVYYNVRNRFYIIRKYRFRRVCYYYSLFSRLVRYLQGVLTNGSGKVIVKAIRDYKAGKMGKQFPEGI